MPLPLTEQRRAFIKKTFSYPEPACAVIYSEVSQNSSSPAHQPPNKRKGKKNKKNNTRPSNKRKEKEGENRVHRPLLLHFHGSLSYPFPLRLTDLRPALLFTLGGRSSLLRFLRNLSSLLPSLGGWRSPSLRLPPGLPLGGTGISPCPVRSSTVGALAYVYTYVTGFLYDRVGRSPWRQRQPLGRAVT